MMPSKLNSKNSMFENVLLMYSITETSYWNELTNSHVNDLNINSFKAGLYILPILAAKAYQAQ